MTYETWGPPTEPVTFGPPPHRAGVQASQADDCPCQCHWFGRPMDSYGYLYSKSELALPCDLPQCKAKEGGR